MSLLLSHPPGQSQSDSLSPVKVPSTTPSKHHTADHEKLQSKCRQIQEELEKV